MRAALIDKPFSIICTDVEEPQIRKENEVKIRVKVTGICGSEVHAYHGTHLYRKPPVVSGHEFAGEVVEVGSMVSKYKVGDRVTAEPQFGCGKCDNCKAGKYNVCKNKVVLGSNTWSGSFGEYVVVPEEAIVSISDTMLYEEATMIEPLAVGMHLIKRSELKVGQTVAIIGAGAIGLGILICAKMAGAKNIIVLDIVEHNLQMAKQLGATHCINSAKEDFKQKHMAHSGSQSIDVVYLAVDASSALQTALDIVSPCGAIAAVTIPKNAGNLEAIVNKELRVIGSLMYVHSEFEIIRDKIEDESMDVSPLISRILNVEDAMTAMEIADKKTENAIKVMMKF